MSKHERQLGEVISLKKTLIGNTKGRQTSKAKIAMQIMSRFGFTYLTDSAVCQTPESNRRVFSGLVARGFAVEADEGFGPTWRLTDEGRAAMVDLEGAFESNSIIHGEKNEQTRETAQRGDQSHEDIDR